MQYLPLSPSQYPLLMPDAAELGDYFDKLRDLVVEAYEKNDNTKATMISYSMGGNILLHFLQRQSQEWKDKYVESAVPVGSPWGGSVLALEIMVAGMKIEKDTPLTEDIKQISSVGLKCSLIHTYLSGTGLDLPLDPMMIRKVTRTFPNNYLLLPSKALWGEKEVLVQTKTGKRYTVDNIVELLT